MRQHFPNPNTPMKFNVAGVLIEEWEFLDSCCLTLAFPGRLRSGLIAEGGDSH